jgi:hypothetical protein
LVPREAKERVLVPAAHPGRRTRADARSRLQRLSLRALSRSGHRQHRTAHQSIFLSLSDLLFSSALSLDSETHAISIPRLDLAQRFSGEPAMTRRFASALLPFSITLASTLVALRWIASVWRCGVTVLSCVSLRVLCFPYHCRRLTVAPGQQVRIGSNRTWEKSTWRAWRTCRW